MALDQQGERVMCLLDATRWLQGWHDELAEERTIHVQPAGTNNAWFSMSGHSPPQDYCCVSLFRPSGRLVMRGYRITHGQLLDSFFLGLTAGVGGHSSSWNFLIALTSSWKDSSTFNLILAEASI